MSAPRLSHSFRFCILLLLAAALRIPGLGYDSFWYDEILTVDVVSGPFSDVVARVVQTENMPPLYYLLINRWVALVGISEWTLRLPSALCGVAAVGVVSITGARLFGRTAGLVGGLLLAVSPYHIAYSMEGRAYSLMFLLAALSCDLFVQMRGTPRRQTMLLYVLVSAAMLWVHPMGGFVLVTHNLFFLLARRYRDWTELGWRPWLIMQGAILCLFGPWLPRLIEVHGAGQPWMAYVPIYETIVAHARSIPILIVWVALAGVAFWKCRTRSAILPLHFALLLWWMPILLPTLLSTPSRPIFTPRYGIAGLLGITFLAGCGLVALGRALGSIVTILLVVLSFLALGNPLHPAPVDPKPHLREAAGHVATRAADGDAILFTWPHDSRPFDHYYAGPRLNRAENLAGERIWVIARAGTEPADPSGYQLVDRHAYPGVNVLHFVRSR